MPPEPMRIEVALKMPWTSRLWWRLSLALMARNWLRASLWCARRVWCRIEAGGVATTVRLRDIVIDDADAQPSGHPSPAVKPEALVTRGP